MNALLRITALVGILLVASTAWLVLGGIIHFRTDSQQSALQGQVSDLWGQPLAQRAPALTLSWFEDVRRTERNPQTGELRELTERVVRSREVRPIRSRIRADLSLDQRRKGLLWFSLYDLDFEGRWSWVHDGPETGTLTIDFAFPTQQGVYDDFRFEINGEPVSSGRGSVTVRPGDHLDFTIGYRSRGQDRFSYHPGVGVTEIEDFALVMTTDFRDIDFPAYTMSPSTREQTADGWRMDWTFSRLVTGHGIGMEMPTRVQPGPLAAAMSFSAPISLGLFMLWIYVLGLLQRVEVHPVNHLFLAGAFFSFHLLFAYSADHLPVEAAFALSAVVSVFLVVSYLRLVVGPRFAFLEAGLAQIVYLVGFALAHFWEGLTGLTITVLGILTLFALMQLTGRIRWSEVMERPAPAT